MRPTERFLKFNASQKRALDTSRNLAVRASAGSGKTSVLVERIAQLLAQSWDDKKPLDLTQIVAITFTRKAAAELEDRLRSAFREMVSLAVDADERAFWALQIDELPRGMIGTIDSFCARILREFGLLDPTPDRIEPDFAALEKYEADVLKREAIDRLINELTSGLLASGASHGPGSSSINEQIEACRWWSATEGYYWLTNHLMKLLDHAVEPQKIAAAHRDLPSPFERVQQAWEKLPAIQAWKKNRPALLDELRIILRRVEGFDKKLLADLRERLDQALDTFRQSDPDSINKGLGYLRAALFTQDGGRRSMHGMKEVEDRLVPLQEEWCPLLESFEFDFAGEVRALEAADKLAVLLGPAWEQYLALCREANQYDFWTVARKTRDLLARDPEICADLKERYRYVMVDEFQDTNPLQWEIISWVVGNGPEGPVDSDRLFIVGDPQQSIYRFRKADVSVFSRVQEKIQEANRRCGADRIPIPLDSQEPPGSFPPEQRLGILLLQENYRSLKPMPLLLMDHVFEYAFDPKIHGLDLAGNKFEIQHQNLIPGIDCEAVGEIRYVIPSEQEADSSTENENDESDPVVQDLAGRQVRAVVDQLASFYDQAKHIVKEGEKDRLSWRDMAILLPSRDVVLGKLEKDLARRGIPYVVTSGIGFWQRQEVRDVVSLACFLADAGDELALFAVLRGPVGQLRDREILFLSQLGRGRILRGLRLVLRDGESLEELSGSDASDDAWSKLSEPVQQALKTFWQETNAGDRARLRGVGARLAGWRQRIDRMAHADLLQRCLEESGAYALYAAEAEGDLMLANLRRLFERIRAEESRSALGLARLARWMSDQVDDALRDEQAVLAADQDAVQIMTVHAAKGLEFPVVAVMKMERKAGRVRPSRLLVKSEWDQPLREDQENLLEVRSGTLAVVVRHPRRPRESYTPRLLKALRDSEQAQELAESRRLFYVAATRAKERLILAGRQPGRKKDGGSYKLPDSWQKWFEESLGLTPEDKQRGVWENPAHHFKISIITGVCPEAEKLTASPTSPPERIHLEYVHERTRSPSIATTSLEAMRKSWQDKRDEWWLRYRVKVRLRLPPPGKRKRGDDDENLSTLVGRIVHRMFEGPDMLGMSREKRQPILEAMAHNMLVRAQLTDDANGEEETPEVDWKTRSTVVSEVEEIIEIVNGKRGEQILPLLRAEGVPEVEFLLKVARWHITGRFDKLLPHPSGGYEIVDWKTDRETNPQKIVDQYGAQMRLYALALARVGRAALIDGAVQVHLALLHHGRVETLRFPLQELEEFASDLEKELQEME